MTDEQPTGTLDLLNTLTHKQNGSVYVNGTTYPIDALGVCRDVNDDDANKLLQGKSWQLWDGTDPREALKEAQDARRRKLKAGHEWAENRNIDKEIEDRVNAELRKRGIDPSVSVEAEEEIEGDGTPGDDDNPYAGESGVIYEVPAEGAEWPDVVEDMPMAYLKTCADAYEVKYATNIIKETLIERLKKEMYETEESE